jgi:hypothetical protein
VFPGGTGIIVHTPDVEVTRAALEERGFDVEAAVAREGSAVPIDVGAVHLVEPYPPMFWLRDPDDNGVLVIQP